MTSTITETQTTLERWTADPSRTMVEFEVKHLWGLHTVRGRFRRFDGVYIVGLPGSEIELTIDAASADTRQRRIGMSQGPLCNVRPPTKLHVKTRLVREGPE